MTTSLGLSVYVTRSFRDFKLLLLVLTSLQTINVASVPSSAEHTRPWKYQRLLTVSKCWNIESLSRLVVRLRNGMSTTRPIFGMRRVTELACPEQPTSRLSVTAGRQQPQPLTVDEFTVLEDKEEELKCAKPRVEQVFKVTFTIIGLLDHSGQPHSSKTSRQIWLQLRGNREDVSKAKVRSSDTVWLAFSTNKPKVHFETAHCLFWLMNRCISLPRMTSVSAVASHVSNTKSYKAG